MLKLISLFLSFIMLTACGQSIPNTENPDPEPNPPPVNTEIEKHETLDFINGDFIGNSAIMLDNLYKNENIMISPMSIYMALGMAATGADEETLMEFEKFLGMNIEDFEKKVKETLTTIPESERYEQNLEIANSIWVVNDDKVQISEKFVEKIKNYYGGEINVEDLDKMVDKINAWVDDKTEGMISEILKELNPKTVSVLINAIYFECEWSDQYLDYEVEEEDFTNIDGKTNKVELMNSEESFYYENNEAIGFRKSYGDGSYYFVGILPKETGEFSLAELDLKKLLESKTDKYDVLTKLPKFEFDYEESLVEFLNNAGIKKAFDKLDADFSNMFSFAEENIYISDVIHATKIENNEWGTKAAAVTAITMLMNDALELNPPEVKKVFLDRPFAFLIMSENSDIPLFMGKIVKL